jgi:hypothetical protein
VRREMGRSDLLIAMVVGDDVCAPNHHGRDDEEKRVDNRWVLKRHKRDTTAMNVFYEERRATLETRGGRDEDRSTS